MGVATLTRKTDYKIHMVEERFKNNQTIFKEGGERRGTFFSVCKDLKSHNEWGGHRQMDQSKMKKPQEQP